MLRKVALKGASFSGRVQEWGDRLVFRMGRNCTIVCGLTCLVPKIESR